MPGNRSAAEIASEITDGLDDSLNPINDTAVVTDNDDNKGNEYDTNNNKSNEGESSSNDSDSNDSNDDGFTIDEANNESDDDSNHNDDNKDNKKQPIENGKPLNDNLTPELQYVVDNIKPLRVRGATEVDGDVKEFEVYDPSQLPQGFRYVDDRERDMATKAFINMETRAVQLVNDFRNQESTKAAKAFKEAEDKADRSDIAILQNSGELPKFKLKSSDPNFDDDPASQLIEKVLNYKDNINQKYLEQVNAGAPYRHIGFEDAFRRYIRENPLDQKTEAEDREDKDRKDIARRTRGGQGDDAKSNTKVPVLHNKREMDSFLDSLEF